MNIVEIKQMLANHKEGLEMQKATHIKDILQKANELAKIPSDVAHSQLIDSILRGIELKNDHLRDIERELGIVTLYKDVTWKE